MRSLVKDNHASGGNNDIMVVLIVLILAATWATWLFLFANSSTTSPQGPLSIPGQNYTAPDSSGFFGQIGKLEQLSINNPEIAFVNGIVFIPIGFILVFIALRFFRGS